MSALTEKNLTDRYTLKNANHTIKDFYIKLRNQLWHPHEVKFTDDRKHYESIPPRFKELYKMFLEFFVCGDSVITEQAISYLKEAQSVEERMFLLLQLQNEQDHIETYTNAINHVLPESERDSVFNAVEERDCVKRKTQFILKYCENTSLPRSTRYLAGAFAEGVFFASLFAIIFYFSSKGVFHNFITANGFILKDEILHRNFNIYMADLLKEFTVEEAHEIAREAYEIEMMHLDYMLDKPIETEEIDKASGMTKENIKLYTQTLVDQILGFANLPLLFDIKPVELWWMEDINMIQKKNFYDRPDDITEYTLGYTKDSEKVTNEADMDF